MQWLQIRTLAHLYSKSEARPLELVPIPLCRGQTIFFSGIGRVARFRASGRSARSSRRCSKLGFRQRLGRSAGHSVFRARQQVRELAAGVLRSIRRSPTAAATRSPSRSSFVAAVASVRSSTGPASVAGTDSRSSNGLEAGSTEEL